MYFNRKEIERDIETLVDILKSTHKVDEYKYLKCNISLLLDLYKNVFHKDYSIIVPRVPLLEVVISREDKSVNQIYREEYLKNKQYHDDIVQSVCSIMSKYDLSDQIKQEPIRLHTFLDIVNSFFAEYGGGLNKTFQDLVKNAHIDFLSIKDNPSSETNNIFMLNKSYVTLNTRNDVEGLLTFAHEIGHAYAHSMIKDNKASYDDCMSFYEFYSSFMERVMIDYLLRNNIMVEDTNKSNYN
jgi:oligoendopeptidase F